MSKDSTTKKRKRKELEPSTRKVKKRTASTTDSTDLQGQISELENQIASSTPRNHNIAKLLSFVNIDDSLHGDERQAVLVSLCKVFTRLMASGDMVSARTAKTEPKGDAQQIRDCYAEYHQVLQALIRREAASVRGIACLMLSMRSLKAQAEYLEENIWRSTEFFELLKAVFEADFGASLRKEYCEEYFMAFHDCSLHTLDYISTYATQQLPTETIDSVIDLLSALTEVPESADVLDSLYIDPTATANKASEKGKGAGKHMPTAASLRRSASSAWLFVLGSPSLTTPHRKRLLTLLVPTILPWLTRPETVFDFLTSSFSQGGSLALLSLSGLYHLITTKNLDYPSFYPKLYSMLTPSLMHSKHRSRFLRHLNIFLSSSHLPATLMASFTKRLSRLTLYAPPAAIVALVPYIYNLLKSHPQTTFMIHRTTDKSSPYLDPFNPTDPNPQTTNAISSSLWELHTLSNPTNAASTASTFPLTTNHPPRALSHFHPPTSSLASIISQQFTKQSYSLEDFLDHSYASMLDSELKRGEVKKEPVVEWRIPKRIFTKEEGDEHAVEENRVGDGEPGMLLRRLWKFS